MILFPLWLKPPRELPPCRHGAQWRDLPGTAYSRNGMWLSLDRRLALVVLFLLALLGSQAASTVCSAQCLESTQKTHGTESVPMGHCGASGQAGMHCVALQSCASHNCTVDLVAGDQNKSALPQPVAAELSPAGLATITTNVDRLTPLPLRSSEGDPPLTTQLRV
jgi:hypothetical protein